MAFEAAAAWWLSAPGRRLLSSAGAAACLAAICPAHAADVAIDKALAVRVHADITMLRHAAFDITKIEALSGVTFLPDQQSAIRGAQVFRSSGIPRWPYTSITYELRSEGKWAGLTLSVDRKYCIAPDDLIDFYPSVEGVPQSFDHHAGDDFVIGFGDDASRVWIVYQKNGRSQCARQFRIEASK